MHTAYVTSKGQLAIPVKLRRKYNIQKGTCIRFIEEQGRIVMQPVTREFIDSLCGMLQRKRVERPPSLASTKVARPAGSGRPEEVSDAQHGV